MSWRSLRSTRDILANLKTGIGANKLPDNVAKISLSYSFKGKNESAGAKHFLHENLPRIQYNNPNVQFEVLKSPNAHTQPTVTVHFADGRSKKLEIPRIQSSEICSMVFAAQA